MHDLPGSGKVDTLTGVCTKTEQVEPGNGFQHQVKGGNNPPCLVVICNLSASLISLTCKALKPIVSHEALYFRQHHHNPATCCAFAELFRHSSPHHHPTILPHAAHLTQGRGCGLAQVIVRVHICGHKQAAWQLTQAAGCVHLKEDAASISQVERPA